MGRDMERDWHRNALVEIVGTFALIFVGAGTIVGAVVSALVWNEVYLRGLPAPQKGAASVDVEQTRGERAPGRAG
jgi:glycerol uptake facilitator-like aquaporin